MDAETLVRLAATDEDHDEMRQYLDEVLELSFFARGPDGVYGWSRPIASDLDPVRVDGHRIVRANHTAG